MFLAELRGHIHSTVLSVLYLGRHAAGPDSVRYQRRQHSASSTFGSRELTLKEALKLALSFESATRNARELHHLHQLQHDAPLERMLAKHQLVFQEGLGTLHGYKAKIYADNKARHESSISVNYAGGGGQSPSCDQHA